MNRAKLTTSNFAFIYLLGFLLTGLLVFVTNRDSCANADYARYMGPETCPTAHK